MLRTRPTAFLLAFLSVVVAMCGPATARDRDGVVAALAAPLPPSPAAAPLTVLGRERLDDRLTEWWFGTDAMRDVNPANPFADGRTGVRVLMPTGFRDHPGRRWPVLYLLHGCCNLKEDGQTRSLSFRDWTTAGAGNAEAITRRLPAIVVMPDGLRAGWYSDSYGLAGEGGPQIETYLIRQLIPWVDANLPTIADRAHRAVAGLSMGGFGAMSLASRHPDLFSAAASFSGAVDPMHDSYIYPVPSPSSSDGISVLDLRAPGAVWGPRQTEEVRIRAHDPVDLAENLRGTALMITVGTGEDPAGGSPDAVETGIHQESLTLHQRLRSLRIPHDWRDYGAGTHTWPYFNRSLRWFLPGQVRRFAHPAPDPRSFVFVSAENDIDVYGFRGRADRGYLEINRWSVSRDRVCFEGSGGARVTTQPRYSPRSSYDVVVTLRGRRQPLRVRADDTGRLSFAMSTGVESSGQQYRTGTTTRVTEVCAAISR